MESYERVTNVVLNVREDTGLLGGPGPRDGGPKADTGKNTGNEIEGLDGRRGGDPGGSRGGTSKSGPQWRNFFHLHGVVTFTPRGEETQEVCRNMRTYRRKPTEQEEGTISGPYVSSAR